MTPWITRMEAVSAAGRGVEALLDALRAGRSLARPVPWADEALRSPFAALARAGDAEEMLDSVVSAVCPAGGAGLVVATSSGAISGGFERWHRAGADPATEQAWRQLPTVRVAARHGLAPSTTLSVACASGTAAFSVARGWLRDGLCERVVVAGVDALSLYVHAGFAGLGALARESCRPFAAGRDGLVLGEGAAAFLLETPASAARAGRQPIATLLGVGLSQDGVHLTAPDRTGSGLARAVRHALADAGVAAGDVGSVSAHATGTVFNDAMEARALAAVFDGPVPLHAAKPITGHTLGAAGALEAAILLALLAGAEAPAPPPPPDDDCPIRFAPCVDPRVGLSVSAAFGGVNAAVVFGRGREEEEEEEEECTTEGTESTERKGGKGKGPPPSPSATSAKTTSSSHSPSSSVPSVPSVVNLSPPEIARARLSTADLPLARIFPGAPPALGRADAYVRAGIAVLAELRANLGPDAAVVLSSRTNCRAADLRYHAGLVAGGPAQASRLHFSYTTPGGPVAEAAILLGLHGPALVFCDAPERAHAEARRLVRDGSAPAAVAICIEAPGPHAEAEAVVYTAPRG